MGQSLFLAQLLGPLIIIVGVSLVFNKKFFEKLMKDMGSQYMLIYLSGLIAFVFGLYILLSVKNEGHFYQILLILFGVIATIKGAVLILFPKHVKKSIKDFSSLSKYFQYFGFACIGLGGYLCYVGY